MPDTTNISLDKMRASAGDASLMLRSLGNQDRLLLLCLLSQEELCVGDLEERLDIRQPSLSQQLGVLRREGLVETRKEGKRVYYRVADPKVLTLLQTLYQLYCAE
ncbi:metalloregulator ArsR/SmtB family transcription factor [Microbulbifer sp. SH-1]|uniref:ArsR/SmtB family transcription factor n=1 Tax=Microbulbifer sp. SH-1 TaxID=2681547 RepID=UPI00140D6365|nr:metalloregulator ArsR/SmtB family transcription factor [Microbulbifer sp. SH-1]QIL89401.1 metalloregulator ArsR/SmtB family transcription factor [Microbulbifer sp. SH-1]